MEKEWSNMMVFLDIWKDIFIFDQTFKCIEATFVYQLFLDGK